MPESLLSWLWTSSPMYSSLPLLRGNMPMISWGKWEYIQVTKKGKTQRCLSCLTKLTSLKSFVNLESTMKSFPAHDFRARWQQRQMSQCLKQLKLQEAMMVMDFAENYKVHSKMNASLLSLSNRLLSTPWCLLLSRTRSNCRQSRQACSYWHKQWPSTRCFCGQVIRGLSYEDPAGGSTWNKSHSSVYRWMLRWVQGQERIHNSQPSRWDWAQSLKFHMPIITQGHNWMKASILVCQGESLGFFYMSKQLPSGLV